MNPACGRNPEAGRPAGFRRDSGAPFQKRTGQTPIEIIGAARILRPARSMQQRVSGFRPIDLVAGTQLAFDSAWSAKRKRPNSVGRFLFCSGGPICVLKKILTWQSFVLSPLSLRHCHTLELGKVVNQVAISTAGNFHNVLNWLVSPMISQRFCILKFDNCGNFSYHVSEYIPPPTPRRISIV